MELAKSQSPSPSAISNADAASQDIGSPIPIGIKRSVSFSDMVAYADAYGPSEYKRQGYLQKGRKRFWRFENDRHDEDDRWFYCEISEDEEEGKDSAAKSRQSAKQQEEEEWDPVLAELMRSMGKGHY